MLTRKRAYSWFLLIIANILFASGYIAAKFILQGLSVVVTLALRLGISAAVLLPFLIIQRKSLHLTRRDLFQLMLLALAGFVINNLLEYTGLSLTTASEVSLLIASESIFTAILSWILLRERFHPMVGFALLIGFLGMYLIIERGLIPNIPSGGGALRIGGDLLVMLGLISESFYSVRGKSLLSKSSPFLITAASIVGSMVFWIPVTSFVVLTKGWHPVDPISWLAIGWLSIMGTVLAYLAWFQGLSKIEGSAAASTLFIQPLVGTLLAVIILHDQLTPIMFVGGALIIISVYIISRY